MKRLGEERTLYTRQEVLHSSESRETFPNPMKCPSCLANLANPSPQCPHCQLSLPRLDDKFGAIPRHSALLTDLTGRIPEREARKLRRILATFHIRFPQSLFSVFLTRQLSAPIAEYTFWIANRGRFGRFIADPGDNFDLLLGIDVDAGTAALVIDYGLEHYLTEEDLGRALADASAAFRVSDFPDGIRACVERLSERMKALADAPGPARPSAPAL